MTEPIGCPAHPEADVYIWPGHEPLEIGRSLKCVRTSYGDRSFFDNGTYVDVHFYGPEAVEKAEAWKKLMGGFDPKVSGKIGLVRMMWPQRGRSVSVVETDGVRALGAHA